MSDVSDVTDPSDLSRLARGYPADPDVVAVIADLFARYRSSRYPPRRPS